MDEKNQATKPDMPADQPPQAAPATAPSEPVMTGGKKSKKPLIIGLVVAGVVLAAAIVFGVYAYVTNTPDYLLRRATEQIAQENAVAMKFKVTSGTESNGVTVSGDAAVRQEGNEGEAVIGIGTGDSRVTVSARVFNDGTFIRFGNLGNFGNLMATFDPSTAEIYKSDDFKQMLSRVNDQWFSASKEDLQSMSEDQTANVASANPEDMKKAFEIYKKRPFLVADKAFADEKIDNVTTGHFSIRMDKDAYKAFLNEVKAANLATLKVTDSDIKNADKDVDEFNKNSVVEAWVTRDSKKLKQLKIVSTEKGSEATIVATLVTELPKFEKLEKPTNAKPFSEFMTTLLGPVAVPTSEEFMLDESYYLEQ